MKTREAAQTSVKAPDIVLGMEGTSLSAPGQGNYVGQKSTGQNSVIWGYCRVSTSEQHAETQEQLLLAAVARRCWTDTGVSGSTPLLQRPAARELLDIAAPGDVILVVRLDRAFRSVTDLLSTATELTERGIFIRALDGSLDTSDDSPTGRLTRSILGSVAAFERELLSARTKEALAQRRAEGVRLCRPPLLTPDDMERARQWRSDGWSQARIAKRLGVSERTVRRVL